MMVMVGLLSSEWWIFNGRVGGGVRRVGRVESNSVGDRSLRSVGDWRVVGDFVGDFFRGGGYDGRGRR